MKTISEGSTNGSNNGADRRTIAVVAGIALVAVFAVAALTIAASAGGSDGTAEGVDANLVGKVWKWTEFTSPNGEKIVVDDPNMYTIDFTSDGTVGVLEDCNSGNGAYTADGSSINIQIDALTRALCSPGSYSEQYVAALKSAALYFFQNGSLFMDLPMDSGTMTFVPGQ